MSWLSKIFKGLVNNRVSKGQYNGKLPYGGTSAEHSNSQLVSDDEDVDYAVALSLSEEDLKNGKPIENSYDLEEDEQFARTLQESMDSLSRPRQNAPARRPAPAPIPVPVHNTPTYSSPSSGLRICAGCKTPISRGNPLYGMGAVWHPDCFRCHGCNKPISDNEFSRQENQPYHKSCFKELFHPRCGVCNYFIPTNADGFIECRTHPFWKQKYCPTHERDGTSRCCSCERMEPMDTKCITLDDGRKLCLECLNSAIMDTSECQNLYFDIQEFYEGLNMKVEQQIPLLLVERQALNEAMEVEKLGHHLVETRGLCLSEEQIVRTILKRPRIGPGNRTIDMITGPYRLVRKCEVTAILVLYGLPRLLTGSILAHEMMHAWLRLKGFGSLSSEVEEGMCQVLAHLWLESEIISDSGSNIASISSSSSSTSTSSSSKKAAKTETEKKLGGFFKHHIEEDTSVAYGDGFRAGIKAVNCYGLRSTIEHIRQTGSFP